MKSRMDASNRTRKIKQKENTSQELDNASHRFFLFYFRFPTSLAQVFLFIWSLIFTSSFCHQIQSKYLGVIHGFNGVYTWFIQSLSCKGNFSIQEAVTCLYLISSHLVRLFDLAKLLKLQEINWLKRIQPVCNRTLPPLR